MSNDGHARILVRATDTGTGIPNLDEDMSGKYRSTTGLGRWLLGVKRLADRFDIKTGKSGHAYRGRGAALRQSRQPHSARATGVAVPRRVRFAGAAAAVGGMRMEHEISRLRIVRIWDQILVPLQGEVTDRLAERLSQEVLDAVHEHGARGW